MEQSWMLLFQSALLGVGLAMDAFSVSLANGLQEPKMPKGRMAWIAGVFAGFQAAMPLAGWFCVRTVAQKFTAFQRFIPWIALALLAYIGGKMLIEGLTSHGEAEAAAAGLGSGELLVQGVVASFGTSIDALSVGFTIAHYDLPRALTSAGVIAAVTFVICTAGLALGKRFGTRLAGRANLLGGGILIAIGLEIFFSGVLG